MLTVETYRGNREPIREGSYGRFLYNYFRYFDPNTGRYLNADPIGQRGGVNLFVYAVNNPVNWLDRFALTKEDIKWALSFVSRRQPDLDVPDDVGVKDLDWLPNSPIGITNPLTLGITIDDYYLGQLTCEELKDLLELLTHESIHRTLPRWHMIFNPLRHPAVYREARERTKKALEELKGEICCDDEE